MSRLDQIRRMSDDDLILSLEDIKVKNHHVTDAQRKTQDATHIPAQIAKRG